MGRTAQRTLLVAPLLLVAAGAPARIGGDEPLGPDLDDTIEVTVEAVVAAEEVNGPAGALSFSWSGTIHRIGPGGGFDYQAPPAAKPSAVKGGGFMAPPFDIFVGFSRHESGETSFAVGLIGRCPEETGRSELSLRTDDSDQGSPLSLTERALREGFERRFAFRVFANQCRFAGDAEVRVTLRKNPVEALLVTDQAYDAWRPQADADEDTPGNTLEVSVVLQKKGAPGVKPNRTARFVFELVSPAGGGSTRGSSREKGVCLNAPPKDQARNTHDLGFRKQGNPLLAKVAQDGQSAETRDGLQEAKVSITSYDWGAYGKLRAAAVLDDGQKVAAHWQRKPDRAELSVPLDENGNHIADQWEKNEGVFEQNLAAGWDGAPNPGFQKADGDGISLYEKYRGFVLETGHERLRPKQKYLFVYDPSGIVGFTQTARASFDTAFSNVSQIDVLFVDGDHWTGPGSQLDGKRVVNFNHGFGHAVDQHALHVEKVHAGGNPEAWRRFLENHPTKGSAKARTEWEGVALLDHTSAYGSPRSVYRIDVYPDAMVGAVMKGFLRANEQRMQDAARACDREAERLRCFDRALDQVLGGVSPEDAGEAVTRMLTLAVSHELGHGVGIDDHVPVTAGDRRCVMRLQDPDKECPPSPDDPYFLKCYQPWPDRISRAEPERCWQQVKVTDRAR